MQVLVAHTVSTPVRPNSRSPKRLGSRNGTEAPASMMHSPDPLRPGVLENQSTPMITASWHTLSGFS